MKPKANGNALKWLFTVAVLLALFTGFGNMPLYGRYYIANIPGFQWSGNFIVNMKVHLVAGAVLLALAVYYLAGTILLRKHQAPRTALDRFVGIALTLVLLSGLIAGVKNFAAWTPGLTLMMAINFFHLGTAMLFVAVGVVSLVVKRKTSEVNSDK
jgi:hypothetical protein